MELSGVPLQTRRQLRPEGVLEEPSSCHGKYPTINPCQDRSINACSRLFQILFNIRDSVYEALLIKLVSERIPF